MKVTVNKSDIILGKRECCTGCPIALALMRTGLYEYVEVLDSGDIRPNGNRHVVSGPVDSRYVVDKFIADFDAGHTVSPIKFDITPYEWDGCDD